MVCVLQTRCTLPEPLAEGLANRESPERAVALWQRLCGDPTVTIVPPSTELVSQSLDLYNRRPDKE